MNRIDRYVIRHVLALTGIVALGLVTIYTLVVFVSDVGETGKGTYGVRQALGYSLLMSPSSLYVLMPIIALLGTLMGIGLLSRNAELTAMRASGVSMMRIGGATLIAGALLGGCGFLLGDWLGPAGERAASTLRDGARGVPDADDHALWLRDADDIVRIDRLTAEDAAHDVTLYRMSPEGRLLEVSSASDAHFVEGHWQLSNVMSTRFDDEHVSVGNMQSMRIDSGISPNVLKLFILEADNLSVRGLFRLVSYMDENGLDSNKYRIWLWRKLVEPLTVMSMMLFAVPFVVGTLRDAGGGQRLIAGVLVGVVFYVLNKVSVSVGDLYQWPAPLAAGLPTATLAIIAFWRLLRSR